MILLYIKFMLMLNIQQNVKKYNEKNSDERHVMSIFKLEDAS